MSNVLKIADFQRTESPDQGVEGRKVADCDNGYTRIANELLDALLAADLTKHQYKVALAIVRKTYGFNKPFDRITNSQISELTKLPETLVCTAKNQLLDMRIIATEGRKIGPNKVLSEWGKPETKTGKNSPKQGNKNREKFPETGNQHSPKQGYTKDTIQKTKSKTPLPPVGEQPADAGLPNDDLTKKSTNIDYQGVADAYNQALGDKLPTCKALNDKRKRGIKKLLAELSEPTVEAAARYFTAFGRKARPFHFGENDRSWRADFDYVIKTDTLLKTREGAL